VIVRVLLRNSTRLRDWETIGRAITSRLTKIEILRTLDRIRLTEGLPDAEFSGFQTAFHRLVENLDVVDFNEWILGRASEPFSTVLGSLDAIHLATALAWRFERGEELRFATHDTALAIAARASGFEVIGA